jgi:hypothetical protein
MYHESSECECDWCKTSDGRGDVDVDVDVDKRERDNEAYDKKSNKIQSIHPACQCRCAQRKCLCKCLSRAAMRLAIIGGRLLLLVVETWRSGGSVLVGIREQVGMRGAVFD